MEEDSLFKILDQFPTGIMIISNNIPSNEEEKQDYDLNQVLFANSFIRKIFQDTFLLHSEEDHHINYLSKLKNDLIKFRKWDLDKLSETTLYDSIFKNNNDSIETYFSDYYMIYVKIKFIPGYILVSIDNFDDERVELRKKLIKSISFQHLTTIHHELNNPLNSLINSYEQIKPNLVSKINLSIFLIKRVIKKFILYTKCIFDNIQMGNNILSIINLKFIFEKIANHMKILFDYKKIKLNFNNCLSFLNNYLYKCDQYYLKEFFKNIFMYMYYIVPNNEEITVYCKCIDDNNNNNNPPKLILSFQKENKNKISKKESLEKLVEFIDILQIKESVKSIEISKEILEKISQILNTKILFSPNEITYIEIIFEGVIERNSLDQDSSIESDINEFTGKNNLYVPLFGNYDTFNNLSNKGIIQNRKKLLIKEQNKNNLSINYSQENSTMAYSGINYVPKNINNLNTSLEQKKTSFSNKHLMPVNLLKTKSLKKIDDIVELSRDPIIDNLKTPKKIKFENSLQSCFYHSKFSTYLKKDITIKNSSRNKVNSKINRSKSGAYDYNIFSKKKNNNFLNCSKLSNICSFSSKKKLILNTENNEEKKEIIKLSRLATKQQENDILIVDDEEFNLNCMRNLLKLEKNKADCAINGEECIKKVIENPNYKIIFMDVYMPIMDGIKASKKIESLINEGKVNKRLIIVIVSAHSQESIQQQMNCISIIKKFIQKPITRKKLQTVLSEFYY